MTTRKFSTRDEQLQSYVLDGIGALTPRNVDFAAMESHHAADVREYLRRVEALLAEVGAMGGA